MSLTVDDFFEAYRERELKQVKLKSWIGKGSGVITLKALSYAETKRFEALSRKITDKKALDMLSASDDVDKYNENLDIAEDYLLKKAISDEFGKLLFSEDEKLFRRWKDSVKPDVVNEIMMNIEGMNELYGGFSGMEDLVESYKKK